MNLITEVILFLLYSFAIVVISKYLLVPVLRKLSELLGLGAKATGNIAGFATSVPELLTVSFSDAAGFIGTSFYNILSSNVINLIQYLFSIYLNKNQKYMSNKAIKIDIYMVLITILIPLVLISANISIKIESVVFFILLLVLFYYINVNVHKLYLEKQDESILEEEEEAYKFDSKNGNKNKLFKTVFFIVLLVLIAVLLYIIGNLLSNTLKNLSNIFNLPEVILGIALGIITSIPELITFIEAQKSKAKNRKNKEIGVVEATNNLLTSNVLNLFAIQSIGIVIYNLFGG